MFRKWKKTYEKPSWGWEEENRIGGSDQAMTVLRDTEELSGDVVLRVGKYSGRTYKYIAERDKHYCVWVEGQKYLTGPLARFQLWLRRNKEMIDEKRMNESLSAKGPLSLRVRNWDVDKMRESGILSVVPQLSNSKYGESRRPRAPVYSLQAAGAIPEWTREMTHRDKCRVRTLTMLCDRFLGYVFRRAVHCARRDPVMERLIADSALTILLQNDAIYRAVLESCGGDPDKHVSPEDAIGACVSKKMTESEIKEIFVGHDEKGKRDGDGQVAPPLCTPRSVLLRFYLTIGELKESIDVYRDLTIDWRSSVVLQACWKMARADGAFDRDRISNEPLPAPLLNRDFPLYDFIERQVRRCFVDGVGRGDIRYGACEGFTQNCPLEADICVRDTVFAVRGSMWISSAYDTAYLMGYVAAARQNGHPMNFCNVIYLQHGASFECDLSSFDSFSLLSFIKDGDTKNACDIGLCEPPPVVDMSKHKTYNKKQEKDCT